MSRDDQDTNLMKDKTHAEALADRILSDARNERKKSSQRWDRFLRSRAGKGRVAGVLLGTTAGWLLSLWLSEFRTVLMIGGMIVGALAGEIADSRRRAG